MSGTGIIFSFTLLYSGIIVGVTFLITISIASINSSKSLAKKAFILLFSYVLVLVITIAIDKFRYMQFEKIPQLSVDGNQMTVINSGTGSMGSYATYACSKEGIIEEIDTPYYRYFMNIKFGFTFEAKAAGDLYVAVIESDCGKLSYADIYEVKVSQDGYIAAENVEHIKLGVYGGCVEELLEDLVDEYGFSREVLEEKYIF